jgi:hypothetical protein
VIELLYHSENNKVFLFKFYFYDRGIIVDFYFGLVKINTKARLHNVDDILVFSKQYQQIYYIYTTSFRKDHSRVDWLFVVKTKPNLEVVSKLFKMVMMK